MLLCRCLLQTTQANVWVQLMPELSWSNHELPPEDGHRLNSNDNTRGEARAGEPILSSTAPRISSLRYHSSRQPSGHSQAGQRLRLRHSAIKNEPGICCAERTWENGVCWCGFWRGHETPPQEFQSDQINEKIFCVWWIKCTIKSTPSATRSLESLAVTTSCSWLEGKIADLELSHTHAQLWWGMSRYSGI